MAFSAGPRARPPGPPRPRPAGRAASEPRRGDLGDLLRLGDVAGEQNHATQPELPGQRAHFRRNLVAVEARNQQLTDLAAERARRHGADSISGETEDA